MPVSGLVITLASAAPPPSKSAFFGLAHCLQLGERDGVYLPAVLDTPDGRSAADAMRALLDDPAVRSVDVVSVAYETADDGADSDEIEERT